MITSDVMELKHVDQVASATDLPFADNSLKAIYLLDVFHHLPDVSLFLSEASRCLQPGGRIIMVEPANTWWGRFIFTHFHHEPFKPEQQEWTLPEGGLCPWPMARCPGSFFSVIMNDSGRNFPAQTDPSGFQVSGFILVEWRGFYAAIAAQRLTSRSAFCGRTVVPL